MIRYNAFLVPELFAAGESTVVYATTEPAEALQLGGFTAVMDAGELLQYGPTAEVFHRPASLRVARAFSDPPMNLLIAQGQGDRIQLRPGLELALPGQGGVTVGVRAGALRVSAQPGDIAIQGEVELAEISGSDTFVHARTELGSLVAQLTGVHNFELGVPLTLYLNAAHVHVFDAAGLLTRAATFASPGELVVGAALLFLPPHTLTAQATGTVAGRIIDLSKAAAGVIGMQGQGVANVRVDVIGR